VGLPDKGEGKLPLHATRGTCNTTDVRGVLSATQMGATWFGVASICVFLCSRRAAEHSLNAAGTPHPRGAYAQNSTRENEALSFP
jgi:hypothetical protein